MCAKCYSKVASLGGITHIRENNWRLLAAQGLRVNAITALMMRFSRRGGRISVNTAGGLVKDYIKWLEQLERPATEKPV